MIFWLDRAVLPLLLVAQLGAYYLLPDYNWPARLPFLALAVAATGYYWPWTCQALRRAVQTRVGLAFLGYAALLAVYWLLFPLLEQSAVAPRGRLDVATEVASQIAFTLAALGVLAKTKQTAPGAYAHTLTYCVAAAALVNLAGYACGLQGAITNDFNYGSATGVSFPFCKGIYDGAFIFGLLCLGMVHCLKVDASWRRLVYLGLLGVGAAGVLLTQSRCFALFVTITGVLYWFVRPRWFVVIGLVSLVCLLPVYLAYSELVQYLGDIGYFNRTDLNDLVTANGRLYIYREAVAVLSQDFGWREWLIGLGPSSHLVIDYGARIGAAGSFYTEVLHAHSGLFSLIQDFGLLGAVPVLVMISGAVHYIWRLPDQKAAGSWVIAFGFLLMWMPVDLNISGFTLGYIILLFAATEVMLSPVRLRRRQPQVCRPRSLAAEVAR